MYTTPLYSMGSLDVTHARSRVQCPHNACIFYPLRLRKMTEVTLDERHFWTDYSKILNPIDCFTLFCLFNTEVYNYKDTYQMIRHLWIVMMIIFMERTTEKVSFLINLNPSHTVHKKINLSSLDTVILNWSVTNLLSL